MLEAAARGVNGVFVAPQCYTDVLSAMRSQMTLNESFTISIEATFSATHRLRFADGSLEPLHGHDWHVRAYFQRAELDEAGMVVDFHRAEETLRAILAPLHHSDLNALPDFAHLNPTAEIVARRVFQKLFDAGLREVSRVDVTEAPGCVASYRRPHDPSL